MTNLGIDIETYSDVSLTDCGVYKYAESPNFALLLFAYCVDGGPVSCVDVASGEAIPAEILAALTDERIEKTAFNATFERVCLSRYLGLPAPMPAAGWRCTMVAAARCGLPLSLAQCSEVLQLKEGKMQEGRTLIRYFSVPGSNGKRHLPQDAPDRWETFKAYNIRDVEVEQEVLRRTRWLEDTPAEKALYVADQKICDRGVLTDTAFVEAAEKLDTERKAQILEELRGITGKENPNSPAQLKEWLKELTGISFASLSKSQLDDAEARLEFWPKARRVIALRRELGKTSNAKYTAMRQCAGQDGRIRGLLQFYGAARTGRWSGRLVQVQNLPQNHLPDIECARAFVKGGDLEELELNYANITQVLSELIRTAFIAKEGHTLHVCDFSAIEARVIAWLAGEGWVLRTFKEGGDIYCATASKMFGVPVEKHGANSHLRQKGKVATLALGYGGGPAALEAMGGKKMGLTAAEMADIVKLWRAANPAIVKLWRIVEKTALAAISTGRPVTINRGVQMEFRKGCLLVKLPSGRRLCYPRCRIGYEKADSWRGDHEIIEYEGVNQTTKKWEVKRTYGGKLVENIVQAIARDILAEVLLKADKEGIAVVFHVHDEIVAEVPEGQPLAKIEALFSVPPAWCKDLPLVGAAFETKYYLKD